MDEVLEKAMRERKLKLAAIELQLNTAERVLRELKIKQDRTKTEFIGLQFLLENYDG
jgi:hypothetical protein